MSSSTTPAATPEPSGHKDGREVEWQMASTDLGSVRRWLADHGTVDGLVLEPRPTLQILDTYLDTDDWRFHRAGFALRIRCESGKSEATLKSLHSASTEAADRRELNETLENSDSGSIRNSAGPVGSRVHAVSGARALLPLFEVRTSRQRFAVHREDEAEQLGEIALDETVISRPQGEPQSTMQRVEVEALTQEHAPLQSLVKTLRSDCALGPATESKYSQGLKSVGLAPGPAPEFAPATVDASMTLAEVALANLRRYLSAWHLHEPGARFGDDVQELHDLRVAVRRFDAILREFRTSLPESFLGTRPTLKTVLRALGHARDLDVALGELDTFSRELQKRDQEGIEPLRRHLTSERARARTQMLNVLDSSRVQKCLVELKSMLLAPSAVSADIPANLARDAAPRLIRRRYRKLRKGADLLTPDSSVKAFHEVRGQLKKFRYALEAVDVIYGKPADAVLRALRRWQEDLGVQQDAAVAGERLKSLACAPPKGMPPGTLFLMGRLAEHYASEALRARKQHAKGYRRVRGRWKKLRLRFKDLPAGEAAKISTPVA